MQWVVVYRLGKTIAFCPQTLTETLFRYCAESPTFIHADQSDAKIGEALVRALEASTSRVSHPNPDELKRSVHRRLEPLGCRSWKAFMRRDSLCCDVVEQGSTLRFGPNRNAGRGFEGVEEWEFTVPKDSPVEALGAALVRAFDIAR